MMQGSPDGGALLNDIRSITSAPAIFGAASALVYSAGWIANRAAMSWAACSIGRVNISLLKTRSFGAEGHRI